MAKVGIADNDIYYYPDCPFANLDDVHILDCKCYKLSDAPGSIGGDYWCSTAQMFKKCPMDVKKRES